MEIIRRYSELVRLKTFEERFAYLKLGGIVGTDTFGFDRWLNQYFYHTKEWELSRNKVIARDLGCDLGIEGRDILPIRDRNGKIINKIIVHHINPLSPEDISNHKNIILDPEFLITVSDLTHKAIHFSDEDILPSAPIIRKPFDTSPWRLNR